MPKRCFLIDSSDMVSNQTSPIRCSNVNCKGIIVRLPSAEGRAQLPKSITAHASGRNRGLLPGPLPGAVIAWGAIYHLISEVSQ